MRNITIALCTLFSVFSLNAQVRLFNELPGTVKEAREATLLRLNESQLRSVMVKEPEQLTFEIPFKGEIITVSVEKNDPLHKNFHLDTNDKSNVAYTSGLYYRGKNASLNFFDGEMNGIISIANVGNLVIAPYKGDYIIYNDASLTILNNFECTFEDPDPSKTPAASTQRAAAVAKCASVYLEVDYQTHVAKGGNLTTTTNWVTSMFNNVQTLFANSGISVKLKNIFVWTSADPYTGSSASAQLLLFHQIRPSFDGDLGQLIAHDPGMRGGIADAIMGVCSAAKYSYVDIDPGFNTFPVYSWSVQGMTHELAHLLGSPHTHACAWNGNNTPIDGCGISMGYTEGSCGNPGIPTSGSIMSYCHLVSGVGINFANGFGSQPAQRILNTMSGATCLSTDCAGTGVACTNGVTAVNVTSQTATSVTFTWTDNSGATSWQVGVFTTAGSGTYTTVTSPSFTKTGLTANTFYKIRIRPVCSGGQTVAHSEFTTVTAATNWCGSTITDSGGASGNYSASENYLRIITPSTGSKARLTFSQFALESGKDYLYVYNGSGTASLLGIYTGSTMPPVLTSTAANGALTIRFISDKTNHLAGFVANITCISTGTTTPANPTTPAPTCTTNTTWNGSSWSNGTPDSTKSAIINGNYTSGTAFTCCNLIINSGKTLTINGGSYITVQNNITINGSLVVKDKGQLIQVSDSGVNTGTGKFSRTTPSVRANDYLYWSSPTKNTTLATGLYGWFNHSSFKTSNFVDVKTINSAGVVTANVPDGIDDDNNVWIAEAQTSVMTPGKGYIARNPTTGIKTKDFSGTPNNGVINVPLSNAGSAANRNYNLVGNPYPSSISANTLIQANTGTTGVLYFWTHKTAPVGTAPGGVPGDYAGISDFSAYSLTGGVASESGSVVPNGVIPSHQAFFVDKTTATSFTFRNNMRSASLANNNFLLIAPQNRFWLSLRDNAGLFRQTLIGYLEETAPEAEWGYDAPMPDRRVQADFYSLIDEKPFLIQSRGDFDASDEVPMGFSTEAYGKFTIEIDSKEGNGIAEVYLHDKYLNKWHDLETAYSFESPKGTFDDRFVVTYRKPADADAAQVEELPMKVYPNPTKGILNISVPFETFEVYDVSGKRLMSGKASGSVDISGLPIGMYLLKIDARPVVKVIKS